MKKQFIILSAILFVSSFSFLSFGDEIEMKQKQKKEPLRSIVYIPVSADLADETLSLAFEYPVGAVTIAVNDAVGALVFETIDTNTLAEWNVSIFAWDEGDYTLIVSYGDIVLEGEFTIE